MEEIVGLGVTGAVGTERDEDGNCGIAVIVSAFVFATLVALATLAVVWLA